jgi:hypothetical protein
MAWREFCHIWNGTRLNTAVSYKKNFSKSIKVKKKNAITTLVQQNVKKFVLRLKIINFTFYSLTQSQHNFDIIINFKQKQ